jgi:GT2 family glycosyltransferase
MHDPVVGVILLNWNGYADTIAALNSLIEATPRPAYVVVVDNGSNDDSAAQLVAWGDTRSVSYEVRHESDMGTIESDTWLRIVLAGTNRGFAGGNNIGLVHLAKSTAATHFLLLNNDALVAPGYFASLASALQLQPAAGILGCTIFNFPDTDRVWFAGGYEDRLRGVALHSMEVPVDGVPFATEWVTGCAMLISRALYDTIGGLAECYFPIYCEDSDYSLRARAANASVMIAPLAHVFHKVGATVGVGEVVPQVAYWQLRHRVFCIRRNYSMGEQIIALSYLGIAKPLRATLYLLRGKRKMSGAIFRGLWHGLRDDAA